MECKEKRGLVALIVSTISLLAITALTLTSVFYLRGQQGDVGPKGETGAAGEKGEIGIRGSDGSNGLDGTDGVDGRASYGCTILPSEDGYVTYSMADGLVGSKVTFYVHANSSSSKVLKELNLYNAGLEVDVDSTKVTYDRENSYWSYETEMIVGGYVVGATFYSGTTDSYFGGDGNRTLYNNGLFDAYGNLIKDGTATTVSFSSGSGTEDDPYMIPSDSGETLLKNLKLSDGTNFKLEGDITTSSSSFTLTDKSKDITLDLDGHTVTATGGTTSGTLLTGTSSTKITLKNGTVSTSAKYAGALGLFYGSSVTAEDVTFKSTSGFGFVTNGSGSTTTRGVFENCTFEGGSFATYIPAGDFQFKNCTFNGFVRINGGKISITDSVVNYKTYAVTVDSSNNPSYNQFDTDKDGKFSDAETRNYMVNYAKGGAGCVFDGITILYGASMEAANYIKPQVTLSNIKFKFNNQNSINASYPTVTNGLRIISYAENETSTFDISNIDLKTLTMDSSVNSSYMNLYRITLGTTVITDEV